MRRVLCIDEPIPEAINHHLLGPMVGRINTDHSESLITWLLDGRRDRAGVLLQIRSVVGFP
jgi:hypothetical protein